MKKVMIASVIYAGIIVTFLLTSCNKEQPEVSEVGNSDIRGGITLYQVNGDELTKIQDYKVNGESKKFQEQTQKHNEIWDMVKMIVPLNYRHKISEFMIYNGSKDGSAGYVVERSNDLSKWQMGIAIDYAYEGGFNAGNELSYTIIHEFGHVLTLSNGQLNAGVDASSCSAYHPGEGCANDNAYINQIYQLYWADIKSEHDATEGKEGKMTDFYNKYQDRFVTQYASTNPAEDIAETWTFFVTQESKPAGNTIAEKKILLLYNYPELLELRTQIRNNLGGFGKSVSLLPKPGSWKKANSFGSFHHSHE